MNLLTLDQQKQLLMLTDRKWNNLVKAVRNHYNFGLHIDEPFTFIVALTSEQWQTIARKLTELRATNKSKLQLLRKEASLNARLQNKKEYMRRYMQRYRQTKEHCYGQGSG